MLHSEVPRSKIVPTIEVPARMKVRRKRMPRKAKRMEGSDLPGGLPGGDVTGGGYPGMPVCLAVIPVRRVVDIPACRRAGGGYPGSRGMSGYPGCPVLGRWVSRFTG